MNTDDITSKASDAASAGSAPLDEVVQQGLDGAQDKVTEATDKVTQFAEQGPEALTQGVSDFAEKAGGILDTITNFFKK